MNDKAREDFAVYASRNGMRLNRRAGDGKFIQQRTQTAWETWQASRESLVIQLPESGFFSQLDHPQDAVGVCRNAIEAAGLKVIS